MNGSLLSEKLPLPIIIIIIIYLCMTEPKGKQDSCSHDKGVQIDCHPHRDEGREMVDLQALDNILCKAQRIRDQVIIGINLIL